MLPTELSSIGDPEESATEYMHYRQFFTIWELYDRVMDVEAAEIQGGMTKDTRIAWLNDYKVRNNFGLLALSQLFLYRV